MKPQAQANVQNGTTKNGEELDHASRTVPELPHFTSNIFPLSNVLKFYTQEAYKHLSRLIENLAHTRNTESDITRKKKFLDLIVNLRRDFIKVYTLVKWAQNSKDVSKLIDLLNYLRNQEFYFENLEYGLNELTFFSGAKLPDSDILTSLEVLMKGRPQLPSYNFIERPPVSSEKLLEVLHDLNIVLTARMALIKELPPRFVDNFEIKDGRVIISIPNEFQVSITVANDLIVENDEDYYKSPFFFIDFAFLFGINPENGLITHRDNKITTQLPKSSKQKLEAAVNQVLLKQSLSGLYETLHRYSISFELYLISRQLKDLAINSKWRNNIQFKYSSSLIIINYWSNHFLSKNWRSFIEIGIDNQNNLNFRWFKNGKYSLNHNIQSITGGTDEEPCDLSVDYILSTIITKHSELLMSKIYDQFSLLVPIDACSSVNPYQLLIHLTPKLSTLLAINPLTGFFYFTDPSPIEALIQSKINSYPTVVKNKNFVSEQDMINNVVNNLVTLRLDTLSLSLHNKLVTTEWIANDIIKFNDSELSKLSENVGEESLDGFRKIQFYRCRNWPSSSFLINMVSGITLRTYWWVARLKSIKGEWKIQWVQNLKHCGEEELDYTFFKTLSKSCSNLIIDHMVVEELLNREIRHLKLRDELVYQKIDMPFKLEHSPSKYESVIILFNDNNLLPVEVSSHTLFLKVSLFTNESTTSMSLSIKGPLKNMSGSDSDILQKLNVNINHDEELFEIVDSTDLSSKMIDNSESDVTHTLLTLLLQKLSKADSLVKMLHQLKKNDIKVLQNSAEGLSFIVDPIYSSFSLKLPENDNDMLSLVASKEEDEFVKLLVYVLNREIKESNEALVGSIRYLKEILPIIKAAREAQLHIDRAPIEPLPNRVPRLQLEMKFLHLNGFQFMFFHNSSNPSAPKKTQKERISFSISFMTNKFDTRKELHLKLSMKENLSSQNLKYKPLFELIFKAASEVQQDIKKDSPDVLLLKLYYDFLMDHSVLEKLFLKIIDCFINYLTSDSMKNLV